MSNTSSDLENRKIRELKTIEDNEQLKSRINILKYTESLRSSENQELLERLSQLQSKLKAKESSPKQQNNENVKGTSTQSPLCDLFTDSVHNDMIVSLCQRLHAPNTQKVNSQQSSVADTTALKYRKDIEDFINELSSKTSAVRASRNILPRRPLHEIRHRRPLLNDKKDDALKDSQMERLYEDTKQLQASLLADIKKLSKSFAQQGNFQPRKF